MSAGFAAVQPEPPMPARIGARYDVISRLGRGGMAVVYRVRDRSRGGELALKQLQLSGSVHDQELRGLFEHEFHILAQLEHPNAVEVHDFGVDAVGPYYTMELLDGGDLSTRAPAPLPDACHWLGQVCSLLSLLHARGVVHRDVTPRNVRFTTQGVAKLIDFGAMVPMGAGAQAVGTPGFVAPEVVHHLALDARTDLFSVGATLYYALTGRRAFAARTLAELNEVWQREPTAPSELVSGIAPALDALLAALLQVDPARRPNSAFEVMQRLAAVSGRPLPKSADIVRAYLATPPLVGRVRQQHEVRRCLHRAHHAERSAVLVQGASGSGRSRLLDACLLDATTSGATVLRADGRAARAEPLASAHLLAEQLLEALPDAALGCEAELAEWLDPATDARPTRLRPLAAWTERPEAAQRVLHAWFAHIAQRQTLAIALDDAERIDAASLGLLLGLWREPGAARLLLIVSVAIPLDSQMHPALALLASDATPLALEAFDAQETDELFAAMFGGAPHASLVSDRVHKVAAGNPRAEMALVHYMLERELIRYAEGSWILPPESSLRELPASSEEALRQQLAALPELARRLLVSQALAFEGPWTRSDYHALASGAPQAADEMLALLLQQRLLAKNEDCYTLAYYAVRSCLVTHLTVAERAAHEQALAEWSVRTARPGFVEAHHLLHTEHGELGLDRLREVLEPLQTLAEVQQQLGVAPQLLAATLEHAHALSLRCGRSVHERLELARQLVGVSVVTDDELYYRYAPALRAQLERDSGLCDYRAADPSLSVGERVQYALRCASERYASLPQAQRVYRVDVALKHLAHYAGVSNLIGWRTQDSGLLHSLVDLLAPWSTLSPALHALWQIVTSTLESYWEARLDKARDRMLELYRSLEPLSAAEVPLLEWWRAGAALNIASFEVFLGERTAERWIEITETYPFYRGAALRLRRTLAIYDGDLEAAERYREQSELLLLQANSPQSAQQAPDNDLLMQVHLNDLAGIKHVADRIAQLAARWPGWQPTYALAQGYFHRLRGDLPLARAEFERALSASDPDRRDPPAKLTVWMLAAEGCIGVLVELGELDAARRFGLKILARSRTLALGVLGSGVVRELALAEAKLGDHAAAASRLDARIAAQHGLRPSLLALDLEVRARVAILARDAVAANHFAQRALQGLAAHGSDNLARHTRLIEEARLAGLELSLPRSAFESVVLEHRQRPTLPATIEAQLRAALRAANDGATRAQRALELLSEPLNARSGRLYAAVETSLESRATLGTVEAALDQVAAAYWQQHQLQASMTTVFTAPAQSVGLSFGAWVSPSGTTYRLLPLSPQGEAQCVGLVAFETALPAIPEDYWLLAAAISIRLQEHGDLPRAAAAISSR